MIVEDERDESEYDRSYLFDENPEPMHTETNATAQYPTPIETLIANLQEAQNFNEHHNLRNDLMEHMREFFTH